MAPQYGDADQSPLVRILSGAWRPAPEPVRISASDLAHVTPALLFTGAAGLAWQRVKDPALRTTASFQQLHDAYRLHSVQSAVHEHEVRDVFTRLRAQGVEPLLLKGWAIARRYPEPGFRPYGDIDLWVPPSQAAKAFEVLQARTGPPYCVEVHTTFYEQYERTVTEVFDRSELLPLDDVKIRIPCLEDHLRYLCLHFLAHGGWRPLWLCDIALVVESRPAEFDWSRCLGETAKYADWVACAIGLAHQLLGAVITDVPVADRARSLPQWLVPAVLRQWDAGWGMSHADTASSAVKTNALRPSRLLGKLKEHWRNPIQASVELSAAFDERPRAPLQLAAGLKRVPHATKEFVRGFRGGR
jgi:hypothetical protein